MRGEMKERLFARPQGTFACQKNTPALQLQICCILISKLFFSCFCLTLCLAFVLSKKYNLHMITFNKSADG